MKVSSRTLFSPSFTFCTNCKQMPGIYSVYAASSIRAGLLDNDIPISRSPSSLCMHASPCRLTFTLWIYLSEPAQTPWQVPCCLTMDTRTCLSPFIACGLYLVRRPSLSFPCFEPIHPAWEPHRLPALPFRRHAVVGTCIRIFFLSFLVSEISRSGHIRLVPC
jgi:hypothetical protein